MNEKTVDKVYCDFCGSELASQDALHSIADCAFYLLKRVNELVSRNSELEAEIDQLTAHSDIERQDDKSPNDTQTQTNAYGKESEE